MAEAQRDLTPEQAAERLRNCPTTHYLQSNANQMHAKADLNYLP